MIISHPFQYVYVAVPKTASVSVKELLISRFAGERHGNAHNVVIPVECIRYYTFCTVRHPYTRAFSFYNFIRQDQKHRCHDIAKERSWEQFMEWMADVNSPPVVPLAKEDRSDDRTVSELEHLILEDSILRLKGRDSNQVDFLSYFLGVNYLDKIDHIIRMEEIEAGFRELPFVTNPVKIPFRNSSRRGRNWRDFMNTRIEKLIYQWAEPDFQAFNYEREMF